MQNVWGHQSYCSSYSQGYGVEHRTAENIISLSQVIRKWGAMPINLGIIFLSSLKCSFKKIQLLSSEAQARGSRVLVLAHSSRLVSRNWNCLEILEGCGYWSADPIREGPDTLNYLRSQGVDLKIISGDNLWRSLISLNKLASKVWNSSIVQNFWWSISGSSRRNSYLWARVPHQKKLLIRQKAAGRTTAMTEWGQWYPCSSRSRHMLMAERNPATVRIANILLNSDFNDVPEILFEGRRVVNNIGRIARLLYQNDLFLPLGYLCHSALFFNVNYLLIFPFIPIQIPPWSTNSVEGFPPLCWPLNTQYPNRLKNTSDVPFC